MKRNKPPSTDQITAELFQTVGNVLRSEIFELIHCIGNEEVLLQQWKESVIVSIY
jgi:hypothetical protein